jgi:hypothetical protein
LRARADCDALHLLLEGLGGRTYAVRVRTPYQLGQINGAVVQGDTGSDPQLAVAFGGPSDLYVRRELTIPIQHTVMKRRKTK